MTQSVTVEGRTLAKALKAATAVVERRNTIPILCNALLKLEDGRLHLAATDLDIMIETSIDVIDAGEDFSTTVNARLLEQIAKLAGPAPLAIEIVEEKHTRQVYSTSRSRSPDAEERYTLARARITIAEGDAVYSIETLPASDFPELDVDQSKTKAAIQFTNGRLGEILDKLLPFISTEETRYYLNGIHATPTVMQATDGHRLCRVTYDKEAAGDWSVIVPRKVCHLLAKFGGPETTIYINEDSMRASARTSAGRFIFKLIDGTYPDTARVIPKVEPETPVFEFASANMRTAIERVSAIRDGQGRAVKIHEMAGEIAITVDNPDVGSSTAKTFEKWPENGFSVAYNGRYLLDILPKSGRVRMAVSDAGSPALIEIEGEEDTIRVIMPMRA